MVDRAESVASISDNGSIDGLTLDDPEEMDDARWLSDELSINILQILYSKFDDRLFNSWWSTGAIRQLTYINRTNIVVKKMRPFVKLGLVDVMKISKLPRFSVTKRGVHGLIEMPISIRHRKKYTGDGYCYKLRSEFVDLIFRNNGNRSLFVPLENMYRDNLMFMKLLLKKRTMIILQAFSQDQSALHKNDFTDYLNLYYNRLEAKDKISEYDLSPLYKLTKLYFQDNLSNTIYSKSKQETDRRFIINRDTLQVDRINGRLHNTMLYTLNFDRVRFLFTNQNGKRLIDNNRSIHFHYPDIDTIYKPIGIDEALFDDITQNGIVVDIL